MNNAGKLIIALATLTVAATPAMAGKKKSKKHKANATAKIAQRSLCDGLDLGLSLAQPTGAKQAVAIDDGTRLADATAFDVSKLQGRDAAMPTGDALAIRMEAETLSQSQVSDVVQGHGGDVEYCWARLPADQRGAAALTLHMTIEARGNVSAMSISGDAPEKFSSCLEAAAQRWQFPIADTKTDADYPLVLN